MPVRLGIYMASKGSRSICIFNKILIKIARISGGKSLFLTIFLIVSKEYISYKLFSDRLFLPTHSSEAKSTIDKK